MNVVFKNRTELDVEPQYIYDIESGVLWIDTLYWTFNSDLKKMEVKHRIYSKFVTFSYLPGKFYLNLEKLSPRQFLVELVREIDDEVTEKGYEMQVSFSIVASPCLRKITYMDFKINNAPVYFNLQDFLSVNCINDVWMIKCVVWMREYLPCNKERRKEQGELWKTKLLELFPESQQYEQMAFIMGRDSFLGMFTGRQNLKFADYKSTLLLRSFRYSDKLLSKLSRRQREMGTEESVEDLGRRLGYIRNGEERCISDKDCILLYASAFFYGLSYLKWECSDYMKMNLNLGEIDFFIDVVTISDMVNDKDLMNYASSWFLKNKRRILRSVQWNNFKNRNYELVRGFRFSFLRYEHHQQEEEVEHVSSLLRLEDDSLF